MKKYVIIVLNQVTVKLQYKFNMGVAFISRTIPIFMSYFLWNNIYNSMNGNESRKLYKRPDAYIYYPCKSDKLSF